MYQTMPDIRIAICSSSRIRLQTFVPFATENYGQITMIDLRYYNENVEEYMKEHQITDVLVLYNITNFISDRNLYKLVGRI